MTIFLMVKTHNNTGLKYLCQTSSERPNEYLGSGLYWLRHLKVHGNNISTEIIKECDTKEELVKYGLFYSKLWDVTNSNDWANLKDEAGDGGAMSQISLSKARETKIKNGTQASSPTIKAKQILTRTKNNTLSPTPETFIKIHESRRINGTTANNKDIIDKSINTKTNNGTLNSNSEESIEKSKVARNRNNTTLANPLILKKAIDTKTINNTLPSNPDVIAKGLRTQEINGTLMSSPEIQAKIKETKKLNGTDHKSPEVIAKREDSLKSRGTGNYEKIQCANYNKIIGKPAYVQYHGDKCKSKFISLFDLNE